MLWLVAACIVISVTIIAWKRHGVAVFHTVIRSICVYVPEGGEIGTLILHDLSVWLMSQVILGVVRARKIRILHGNVLAKHGLGLSLRDSLYWPSEV
jgi:hypothetical protein